MASPLLSRRDLLTLSAAGAVGFSFSGWLEALANETAAHPQRRRSCILLWMNGGPSQLDTFDLKPGHANGGPARDADERPRRPHQRAPATPRPPDAGHGHHPLDEHAGRRPWPRHISHADRLSSARPHSVSDDGLAALEGAGRRRLSAAELRQHRPLPTLQPWRLFARLPRAAVRSVARRRRLEPKWRQPTERV